MNQESRIFEELGHYARTRGADDSALKWGEIGARNALREGMSGFRAYSLGRQRIDDALAFTPEQPRMPRMLEILTTVQGVPCTRVQSYSATADGYQCRMTDYRPPARTFYLRIGEVRSLRADEADSQRVVDIAIERARREA